MVDLWVIRLVHTSVIVVFLIGLIRIFLHRDFVRQIVGLKLMLQSISLGLIFTGWRLQMLDMAQSMVISALVIEAVVIGLALTMIIHIRKHQKEDLALLEHLKKQEQDTNA
jgi:NADH:ubiquinone oxidoreductase subunit K